MGSYSAFNYEDIEVKDFEGLKKWKEKVEKTRIYKDDLEGKFRYAEYQYYWTLVQLNTKDKTASFETFDDMKIISYWYEEFVTFLRDIAIFIEGDVHWTFENNEEGGYVSFQDGNCTIHTGQMQWEESTTEQIRTPPPMPKQLKAIIVAREI